MNVPASLLRPILLAFNGIPPLNFVDICRTEKCLNFASLSVCLQGFLIHILLL